jgi:hypothetical protein
MRRKSILLSITLVETPVPGPGDGEPGSFFDKDGFWDHDGWKDHIQKILATHIEDQYATDVEVLMLTDQGEA